jgi:hypothetical protein
MNDKVLDRIRRELGLAETNCYIWRVDTTDVDTELSVIALATYDGRALLAEVDRLRKENDLLRQQNQHNAGYLA